MTLPTNFGKATEPGGTAHVLPHGGPLESLIVTFYYFDCPQCHKINVGDDMYDDWKGGKTICSRCGYEGEPKTWKVDINA